MSRERVKDVLVALSLANLSMTRVWDYLWGARLDANRYFLERPLGERIDIAIAGCVALTLLLLPLARAARGEGRSGAAGRVGLLLMFVMILNGLRQTRPDLSMAALATQIGMAGLVASCAILLGTALLGLRVWGLRRISNAALQLTLAVSPLAPLTLAVAASMAWSEARGGFDNKAPAARLPGTATTRVFFLVFDGLDQDMLVTHRPDELRTPEFDRLVGTSTSWENAYPPSNTTRVSLPALITGRPLKSVQPIGPDDALLQESGQRGSVRWSEAETLFSRARALGANAALVGWYHPYCRVLGAEVTACTWYPYQVSPGSSAAGRAGELLATLVDTFPGAYRTGVTDWLGASGMDSNIDPAWHARQYAQVHSRVLQLVSGGEYGLVFVHYPIPHPPFFYDRATGSIAPQGGRDYLDALALVDRTLGELVTALKRSGRAEETAIVLTSDHGLRRGAWRERGELFPVIGNLQQRVPLIVRLPGQREGVLRREIVRTVHAQDVALAILEHHATHPDEVAAILKGRD